MNFLTLAFGSSAFGRWIWLEDFLWPGAAVAGWDVGQMVLKADLQSLFPSNLDLAVGGQMIAEFRRRADSYRQI